MNLLNDSALQLFFRLSILAKRGNVRTCHPLPKGQEWDTFLNLRTAKTEQGTKALVCVPLMIALSPTSRSYYKQSITYKGGHVPVKYRFTVHGGNEKYGTKIEGGKRINRQVSGGDEMMSHQKKRKERKRSTRFFLWLALEKNSVLLIMCATSFTFLDISIHFFTWPR